MTTTLVPSSLSSRVETVDVLRGVAVLGILTMNIVSFALPGVSYINPMADSAVPFAGPFDGADRLLWWAQHLLADQKFMAIFSMLFGAGLILQGSRAADPAPGKARFAAIYYRRLLWLFLIGMLHAYLLWYGDILVAYALCGLLLYPLRNFRWGWLLTLGIIILLVAVVIQGGMGAMLRHFQAQYEETLAAIPPGQEPTLEQRATLDQWAQMSASFYQSPETVADEVKEVRSGYGGVLGYNARTSLYMQTFLFAIWTFWRASGCMLIGMALMKLGFFANKCSRSAYATTLVLGYAIGLPLAYIGGLRQIDHDFDMIWAIYTDWHFNYVGSVLVALGHVSLVMLLVRMRSQSASAANPPASGFIASRFAAVGRMPLTNYLAQTLLCTFVFFGWGLAQFGHWTRAESFLLVPAVWALLLLWSPWWLARFRFGPAEWLWRSLTYWHRQPMRHAPQANAAPAPLL